MSEATNHRTQVYIERLKLRIEDKNHQLAETRAENNKYKRALNNADKKIEELEKKIDQLLRNELICSDNVAPLEFVRKIA